jgi:hypothetical protein
MIKSIAHDTVEMVQKSNKQIVTTFVKHEALADTMLQYIDTQTKFTKDVVDSTIANFVAFGTLFTNKDFGKELVSAYSLDKFVPTTTAKAASKKAK